jgi:hypothetical protein
MGTHNRLKTVALLGLVQPISYSFIHEHYMFWDTELCSLAHHYHNKPTRLHGITSQKTISFK